MLMHRPKYTSEVIPAERVSIMLEYLIKRVQDAPEAKSRELRNSISRACELIAARNNYPGHFPYGGMKPTYTDEIILDAFRVCMKLNMQGPLRHLATAFKNELPEFVIQSLQNLIHEVGFEEIKPM